MAIKIINDKCKGCSLCVKACPFDALKLVDRIAVVDEGKCTNCNACIAKCKFDAIEAAPEAEKLTFLLTSTSGYLLSRDRARSRTWL